ncbi:MAG TPA: hypothetical protein VFU22_05425 [Roseiflexaceae bacterium]|nr:hypothetical protein [Roseiflexaceae bacterium]
MIWAIFSALLIAISVYRPNAARIVAGLFFLLITLGINLTLLVVNVGLYMIYGSQALLPIYRWFFREVVALSPSLFVLLLIVYETIIGLLMLSKGRYVRLGLAGGILFLLAITPLSLDTLGNLGMAGALALLLRQEYNRTLIEIVWKSCYIQQSSESLSLQSRAR